MCGRLSLELPLKCSVQPSLRRSASHLTRVSRFASMKSIAPIALLAGLMAACFRADAPTPDAVATQFALSVSGGDIARIIELSATPLSIRQQEWETARDGAGFVLGKARDTQLKDTAQIRNFFSDPKNKIAAQTPAPDAVPASLLETELRGKEGVWQGLSIQLFRRGIGDVEHIFVVGVDDKGKVAAVYVN